MSEPDPAEIQDAQRANQRHAQNQQVGLQQQQSLQDMLGDPQVVELLLESDLSHDDPWVEDLLGEHLHIDEVLAQFDGDDLWRKGWHNRIVSGKVQASFPPQESRSSNDRVNHILERVHGVDHQPLTPRQRQTINSKLNQKTDRAKRGKDGTFLELFLGSVVKSEEKRSDDTGDGDRLLGGLWGDR